MLFQSLGSIQRRRRSDVDNVFASTLGEERVAAVYAEAFIRAVDGRIVGGDGGGELPTSGGRYTLLMIGDEGFLSALRGKVVYSAT